MNGYCIKPALQGMPAPASGVPTSHSPDAWKKAPGETAAGFRISILEHLSAGHHLLGFGVERHELAGAQGSGGHDVGN